MRKEKLNIDEQIMHMKNYKGIKFNIINEKEAKVFLSNHNYYFKLKSYAKNYDKYKKGTKVGQYINLEFAYLQELSTIDMHLRKFIMRITIDIEHFLKTKLLKDFAYNPVENGYDLVDEFLLDNDRVWNSIIRKGRSSFCSDLVIKYEGNFAIWNIVEVLSLGDFINLYNLYYEKYNEPNKMRNHLYSVRILRNAAAHNNCLINSLKKPYSRTIRPNMTINTFVSKIQNINSETRRKKMVNPFIHDFVVTLYVFNDLIESEKIKYNAMSDLKYLIDDRMLRNKEYFKDNQAIVSSYLFVKNIVDYFCEDIV